MMELWKEAADWAVYNWENFRGFYIMLCASGVFLGIMLMVFIYSLFSN